MRCSLANRTSFTPDSGPDLRAELEARRRTQRDVRLAAKELRLETRGRELLLRVGDEAARLTPSVTDELARHAGVEDVAALRTTPERLDDWLEDQTELLVRLEGSAVRAVLPADARFVDHLELVDATLASLARVPHEVRVDICDLSDGDLHLALASPSLAREVREGDYLYGGFCLASSETGSSTRRPA